MVGTLPWVPALSRTDLLADPVTKAVEGLGPTSEQVRVAEIDPELADTRAFCDTYGVGLDISANCVVVAATRGGQRTLAACVVLATSRARRCCAAWACLRFWVHRTAGDRPCASI